MESGGLQMGGFFPSVVELARGESLPTGLSV